MEANGYPAVNSVKTISMKRVGNYFIIHGLFADDMMDIPMNPINSSLWKEFMDKYSKDYDITGGVLMESFLGMEVEQSDDKILCRSVSTVISTSRTLSMNTRKKFGQDCSSEECS
jgi:hypothetical protein